MKFLKIGLGAVLLVIIVLALDVARFGGVFRSVEPGFAGHCREVALGGSSEDIQVDRERGIAYLSVLDRATLAGGEVPPGEQILGSIMLLDLNLAEPAPRAALAFDPKDFRPHGLSLLEQPGKPARLFAISHPAENAHTVEIFEQDASGSWFPKDTVRDPAFTHPNAIAAVGPRQFYLVNDRGGAGRFSRATEILFRRGLATLLFFDGRQAQVIAADLKFPAGLALSPDGTHLYVGEALGKQLRVYRRDPTTQLLALEETVPLDTAPDNLNVDGDGVVWIAAHPKLLAFNDHVKDPARPAPTQVLRFDPRAARPSSGPDTRITQVYADGGAQISAGTVAAHWRDEFLIGALLQHEVLICKPNP